MTGSSEVRSGDTGRGGPGRLASRRRRLKGIWSTTVTALVVLSTFLFPMPPANAGVGLGVVPSFNPSQTVGNRTTAIVTITNLSNNLGGSNNADDPLTLTSVTINPSCDIAASPCPAGNPDVGVGQVTAARGVGGACAGTTFTVGAPDGAGNYPLTAVPPVILGPATPPPPPPPPASPTCTLEVDFNVLRRPADGSSNFTASATATSNDPTSPGAGGGSGSQFYTVAAAATDLTTVAAQTSPMVPASTSDQATLTGPANPPPGIAVPTGSIIFRLFGPFAAGVAPSCTDATEFFESAPVPVNGFTTYNSPSVPIGTPGTYTWVATYSGDQNYAPDANACGEPAETVTFAPAQAVVTTVATPTATPGSPITDTATVTGSPGGPAPTGTVTFRLYSDQACATQIFEDPNRPLTPTGPNVSQATSNPFVPPGPGTYNWRAFYNGDGVYGPASTPCLDANETSTVSRPQPTINTVAVGATALGQTSTDRATLNAPPGVTVPPAPAPAGDIVFRLFGPQNITCDVSGPVHSVTAPVAVNHFGPPEYVSPPSNPITVPGTYQWVAYYSGDANYMPATSACNDPAETFTVAQSNVNITTVADGQAQVGQPIGDSATVTGGFFPAGGPAPGTVTFTAYGPNDPTCTNVAYTRTVTIPPGTTTPFTIRSDAGATDAERFRPSRPGTYQWIARYDGNVNNAPVATACNDPAEQTPVTAAEIRIVTQATPTVTFNGANTTPVTDVATVTGYFTPPAPTPAGNLIFRVYGPNDINCTGAPTVVPPPVPVTANGDYTSGPFVPPAPGTYQWVVEYTGDAFNAPRTTACGDPNETTVVTVTPTIDIIKTANPTSRPEPGGDFTYTIVVTNTSAESLRITSLTDSVYGDLSTRGTCTTAVGTVMPPGGTYTCEFTAPFTGNEGDSLRDVATVRAVNPTNVEVTDSDDAVVTITGVLPAIEVEKTASPLSRPEPGGDFTYTIVVRNPSAVEAITITSLNDNVYGDLATRPGSTCGALIGTTLAPGASSAPCTFTAPFTGNAGQSLTDVVTVTGVDDDGDTATDTDDATVTITDVLPVISVVKTADPLTRPEPGGDFTFTVVVTNNSIEPVTITSLNDNVYGNLNGRGSCATGAVLQPGQSYTCSFVGPFRGNAGASQTDVVTATAVDDDGNTATASDDATVTILNVIPAINVEKDASPASRPEPGGDFTFSVRVTNTGNEAVTITSLTDDIYGNLNGRGTCATGAVLQPGQSYTCSFTGAFTGNAGASQTDTVTAVAVDDDGTSVTDNDTATVTITGVPPVIDVTKTASPLSRPEPGGDFTYTVVVTNTSPHEAVTITSLTDNVYGDLTTRSNSTCTNAVGTVLQPGRSYTCTFTAPFTGDGGRSLTDVVTATAVDDDGQTATDTDDATVTITDVLPTIRVDKTANPLSRPEPGGSFTFSVVVTNTSIEPVRITSLTDDVYGNLNGRGTCAIGATLQPGQSYSCSFTGNFTGDAGASQTDTVTAVAVDNENNQAIATDIATVTITDVPPTINVDKTASPLSRPEPGGTFTFTVVVTNTSIEPVRITSLTDDVYGNLNGRGTCAVGAVLAPGASYTCSFSGSFIGDAGQSQTDTVTAVAVDNEGSQAIDSDIATVTITNVPPTITVVKKADPTSLPAPGGNFTFFVTVTNTSNEPVRITSLADDIYGNLHGQGTCAVGAVLQPNQSYSCSFVGSFTGPGGSQTDIVTAVAVDNEGSQAIAQDRAIVHIIPVAPPPPPPKQPLPRTGGDLTGPARLAASLIVVGGLMVAATWRWNNSGPALAFTGAGVRGARWFRPPPERLWAPPPGPAPGGGGATAPPPAAAATGLRLPRPASILASGMGLAADRNGWRSGQAGGGRGPAVRAGLDLFGAPLD